MKHHHPKDMKLMNALQNYYVNLITLFFKRILKK